MYLRAVLPQHHVRDESKALIEKSTGIIATIAALVLGLLIASAKNSFDAKTDELTRVSAQIVFLDRGPDKSGKERFERWPVVVDEGEGSKWLTVDHGLAVGDQVVTSGAVLISDVLQ